MTGSEPRAEPRASPRSWPLARVSTSTVLLALVALWHVLVLGSHVLLIAGYLPLYGLIATFATAHLVTALVGGWLIRADDSGGLSVRTYVVLALLPPYGLFAYVTDGASD